MVVAAKHAPRRIVTAKLKKIIEIYKPQLCQTRDHRICGLATKVWSEGQEIAASVKPLANLHGSE